MKKISLITGSIFMIGCMSACDMSDRETAPSHSVSNEAEKNALEAEQAELELAKLAEMQKLPETKSGKSGGRKPASTGAAKVVKAEAAPAQKPAKKKVAAEKKVDSHAVAEVKPVVKKATPKVVEKKTEAHVAESPQATAKKEIAAGESSVLNAQAAQPQPAKLQPMKVAMNTDPAAQPVTKTLKAHSAASSVYIVQVGAFKVKDNALKLEEKLKGSGFPVRMREVNHSKNGMLYVVQFEPTPNRDEADAWRSQVKAKASLDAQLVARPD
ncbi:MAG: SPOR domain-containing protein [Bdellovibrionota bacterium]